MLYVHRNRRLIRDEATDAVIYTFAVALQTLYTLAVVGHYRYTPTVVAD